MIRFLQGDCLAELPKLGDERFHACVTDPPYGLKFMGQMWDHGVPSATFWTAVKDQLLPGAHLFAFGGSRTAHRLACAIEDAGFEIRDTFMWVYGSGFPKSHDVSKGIDKAGGAVRERVKRDPAIGGGPSRTIYAQDAWTHENAGTRSIAAPATPEAAQWSGWGTAVKPAWEPIILARKPLAGTVAQNVLAYGTGAMNIDACRIDMRGEVVTTGQGGKSGGGFDIGSGDGSRHGLFESHPQGRWPANVIHDGSDEVLAAFARFGDAPGQMATTRSDNTKKTNNIYGAMQHDPIAHKPRADSGTAARFFPCCPWSDDELRFYYSGKADSADRADSKHPTVKPVSLMRWLVRLITPPGGHVLDPFAGSGTTGEAAMLEGFDCTLIEKETKHAADIEHRIRRWSGLDTPLFEAFADA